MSSAVCRVREITDIGARLFKECGICYASHPLCDFGHSTYLGEALLFFIDEVGVMIVMATP